jgi:hypothetical protein
MHFCHKIKWRAALGMSLTLAATSVAWADITTTISGFGTVGGSFTSDKDFAYKHDSSEFTGATNQFDIGLESRFGVQAKFDFGSGFSVTGQEVFRERGSQQFDPGTEWLYAQYSPIAELQIRVGRVVLPVFLFSDSRQVGYAQPWFRSPEEVYGNFPFNYVDGGQVSWTKSVGEFTFGVESSFGSTSGSFADGSLTLVENAKDILNGALSLTYGDLLLRVADTVLTIPTSLPLSPDYTLSYSEHGTYLSVGGQYDNGKAVLVGEWTKSKQNDVPGFGEPLVGSTQWYAAAGWRFGKFLPMAIYGAVKNDQSLLAPPSSYGSWSGNLRYDLMTGVALKAEVSRTGAQNGAYFIIPSTTSNRGINVYSLGVDFVF